MWTSYLIFEAFESFSFQIEKNANFMPAFEETYGIWTLVEDMISKVYPNI